MELHQGSTKQKALDAIVITALAVVVILLYWSTRSTRIVGHDGAAYLESIRNGHTLFHPHHLIFNALNRWLFIAIAPIGVTAETVVILHNVAWVIIASSCTYGLVSKLTHSLCHGVVASLYVIFANASWFFALQYEAYPAAVGAALATFSLAASGSGDLSLRKSAGLVLSISVAVLYYQANALLVLPIGAMLLMSGGRRQLPQILAIIILSGVLVILVYLAAFYILEPFPECWGTDSFLRYILLYTTYTGRAWGHVSNFSLRGAKHLFGGVLNNYLTPSDQWRPTSNSIFCAVLLITSIGRWDISNDPDRRPLFFGVLLWLTVFTCFVWWWSPTSELRAIVFPPLNILLIALFDSGGEFIFKRSRIIAHRRSGEVITACFHAVGLSVVVWVNYAYMQSLQ